MSTHQNILGKGTDKAEDAWVEDNKHDLRQDPDLETGNLGPNEIDFGYEQKDIVHVTRKVDRRLIPVLSLMYCISFIDRTNLSLARAANGQKMNTELDLLNGNNRYGLATLIFFVPYILLEIPVSLL